MIAMQSVCEDRLHKSQVGAVVARYVHIREVADSNSAPATLIFLGDAKVRLLVFSYYRKAYCS